MCIMGGEVKWKFLGSMVMTTKALIPHKHPHALYSLAAHISFTTFHTSRPDFPRLSFVFPPPTLTLTSLLQSVLFLNQSNAKDLHFGDFIPSKGGGGGSSTRRGQWVKWKTEAGLERPHFRTSAWRKHPPPKHWALSNCETSVWELQELVLS